MRLIDANELLLRFIPRGGDNQFTRFVRETVRLRLEEMPTIDAEPKHGRWIEDSEGWWHCSECGRQIPPTLKQNLNEFHKWCGRCGAKMDEV